MKKTNFYMLTISYVIPISNQQIVTNIPLAIQYDAGQFNAGSAMSYMQQAANQFITKEFKTIVDPKKIGIIPYYLGTDECPAVSLEPRSSNG